MTATILSSDALALSAGLRRFLYATAAITGGAIMVIEILGAKMLAPYVGTSHFVWTAQIAVTLMALATGYYWGGQLADRGARLDVLYTGASIAGVYLCLTVLIARPVAFFCLELDLAIGTLAASLILFFVPLALLAMTAPFLVRATTASLQAVGGSVGRLTAVSTLGSFAGTALIGYVLIPWLAISQAMWLCAGLLIALGLSYFAIWRRRPLRAGAASVVAIALAAAGYYAEAHARFGTMHELMRRNSNFGLLQVLENASGSRVFLTDFLKQNSFDPAAGKSDVAFSYVLRELVYRYTASVHDVLIIGMGIGVVAMDLARDGVRVDVVEINPEIVPIAQRYFGFEPGRVNVAVQDGRYFINRSAKRYDAIILDAFLGDSAPSHLMTREAFAAMRAHLRDDGVLVVNCFGMFDDGHDFLVSSLFKTLSAVFEGVRVHNERNGTNVFFAAGHARDMPVLRQPDLERVPGDALRASVRTAIWRLVDTDPEHGIVLTDDFNPVDYRDASVREMVRRASAGAMETQ